MFLCSKSQYRSRIFFVAPAPVLFVGVALAPAPVFFPQAAQAPKVQKHAAPAPQLDSI